MHIAAGTVLTCGKDNLLKTVNPGTFDVMQTFRAPQFSVGTIWCTACISPDGRHVAAGSGTGTLFVWNVSFLLNHACCCGNICIWPEEQQYSLLSQLVPSVIQ